MDYTLVLTIVFVSLVTIYLLTSFTRQPQQQRQPDPPAQPNAPPQAEQRPPPPANKNLKRISISANDIILD